ncbi:MAG: DeoR family transcriptional regulator [Bacilli bacterium]|nr:DeoR family transcriptional regulator [Bacilli bacterium]
MLVHDRHQKILQLVKERGSIRVSELSEICQVTEETIRRDLDKLEGDGKLLRSHGGAVSMSPERAETPFFEREITNIAEKKQIAKAAVQFIEPQDRILLDASTTAWYMACSLPDMPLTILTNSVKVAMELSAKEQIEVISTGGNLVSRSLSFVGPLTERSLEFYHVNKAFVSCQGLDEKRGISESNELVAQVKRTMINIADQVFLLADYSKIGVQAFAHVCDLNRIQTLITDAKTDPDQIAKLREESVEVIQLGETPVSFTK